MALPLWRTVWRFLGKWNTEFHMTQKFHSKVFKRNKTCSHHGTNQTNTTNKKRNYYKFKKQDPSIQKTPFDLKDSLIYLPRRLHQQQYCGAFALFDIVTCPSSLNDGHKNLWIRANGLCPSPAPVLIALVRGSLITVGTFAKDLWLGFSEKNFSKEFCFSLFSQLNWY